MNQIITLCKACIMGLAFFCTVSLFASELVKDKAVFTVDKRAFFMSDVKRYISSFERLNCLYSDSLLSIAAELEGDDRKELFQNKLTSKNIDGVIKVIKISQFADSQVSLDFSNLWKSFGQQRCLKNGPAGWSHDLKLMFLAETFLRERFQKRMRERGSSDLILFGSSISKKYKHHVFN